MQYHNRLIKPWGLLLIFVGLITQGTLYAQSAYLENGLLTLLAVQDGDGYLRVELEQVGDQPAEFQLVGVTVAVDVEPEEASVYDGSILSTPFIILNGISFSADFVLASLDPPVLQLDTLQPVGGGAGFADIEALLELSGAPGPQGPPGPPGPVGPQGPAGGDTQQTLDRLASLEATVNLLQDQLDAANDLIAAIDPDGILGLFARNGSDVFLHGVNLHVTNGTGNTASINGLGNIIIGYNEPRQVSGNERSGSHTLVVGSFNNFSSYGGIVAGAGNSVSGPFATVSGGEGNIANNSYASISGGRDNTASGAWSAISGGRDSLASGEHSFVGGGEGNWASGAYAAVTGGSDNEAEGARSVVSGGLSNQATGDTSSVSGGRDNTASSSWTSVSGGRDGAASGVYASVSGGRDNEASGDYAAASGGSYNVASGNWSSVSGGTGNEAEGPRAAVTGGEGNLASGNESAITGGRENTASGDGSSVSGGRSNEASGDYAIVTGGFELTADMLHQVVP